MFQPAIYGYVLQKYLYIFTLFCIQVTSFAFWIELDLIFTFICIQVVIMVFCIDLDSASPLAFFAPKCVRRENQLPFENQSAVPAAARAGRLLQ